MSYDRAITVFSPDGHLFQVEYAMEAVRKGSTAVAIRGGDCIVIGVEKKATATLQQSWTVRKICLLDHHLVVAFAGLTADARVLINQARLECQSYRLAMEDAPSVEYVARHIASVQQKYTQTGGRRPFGISMLIAGHDLHGDGKPHLYQSDPSGTYSEWSANAIGRNSKTVTEFLEKQHTAPEAATEEKAVKLTVQALLEVVDSSAENIEICVVKKNDPMYFVPSEQLEKLTKEIVAEKEAAKQREKKD